MLQGTKHAIKSFTKFWGDRGKLSKKTFNQLLEIVVWFVMIPYRQFSNLVKQPLAPEIVLRNIVSFNIPYIIYLKHMLDFLNMLKLVCLSIT